MVSPSHSQTFIFLIFLLFTHTCTVSSVSPPTTATNSSSAIAPKAEVPSSPPKSSSSAIAPKAEVPSSPPKSSSSSEEASSPSPLPVPSSPKAENPPSKTSSPSAEAPSPTQSPTLSSPKAKSSPHPSKPLPPPAEAPSPTSDSTAEAPSPTSDSTAEAPDSSPPSKSSADAPESSRSSPSHTSNAPLDPKQVEALKTIGIPAGKNPCAQPSTVCDTLSPHRHLISLSVSDCSDDFSLTSNALKALSTLQNLSFTGCSVNPVRFPSDLAVSLRSFSLVDSPTSLTSFWLSRFVNLKELVVSDVPLGGKGLYVILGNMLNISSLTITRANLSGNIPKHLNTDLKFIDLSRNNLKGRLPESITSLDSLESLNINSNAIAGEIPDKIGEMSSLKNLSLGSNALSGSIPDSLSSISKLVHLDLSSNQFNGSVPKFISNMRHLKYLNLQNNNFEGILPFNQSFLSKLEVFKVGGNSEMCYNSSALTTKSKLGISPCDKHGRPVSKAAAKDSESSSDDSDMSDYADTPPSKEKAHHGPNKVTLGVSIALAAIIFLIVFLVLMSKRCCCC